MRGVLFSGFLTSFGDQLVDEGPAACARPIQAPSLTDDLSPGGETQATVRLNGYQEFVALPELQPSPDLGGEDQAAAITERYPEGVIVGHQPYCTTSTIASHSGAVPDDYMV